jgi:hypothetical protein
MQLLAQSVGIPTNATATTTAAATYISPESVEGATSEAAGNVPQLR